MEKRVRKFKSHAEAEDADREYYRSLTPEQRMKILFQLIEEGRIEASEGFQRVYQVVKLGED